MNTLRQTRPLRRCSSGGRLRNRRRQSCSRASHRIGHEKIARRSALIDHLIGAQQNRWGYGKAERRGGIAVHDHDGRFDLCVAMNGRSG